MIQAHRALQNLMVFGSIVPLAIFLGYLAVAPPDNTTIGIFALLFLVLASPFLLRLHHTILIFTWQMSAVIFFLPGSIPLWLFSAGLSFGMAVFQRAIDRKFQFYAPAWTVWPMLFMAAVTLLTAYFRGGIGFGILGGSVYGGKRYVYVLGAILGFFALTSKCVPLPRARMIIMLYFLTNLTAVIGSTVALVSPNLYFLYRLFPADVSGLELVGNEVVYAATIFRSGGVAQVGAGTFYAMLAIYGVKGVLDLRRPWRILLFLAACGLSTLGGFRSMVAQLGLTFTLLFFTEGLYRTRLLPILILVTGLAAAALVPMASRLPPPVQRSLSFLPLDINHNVRMDAQASTIWRLEMWRILYPDIPRYFWAGKGFAINGAELEVMIELVRNRGGSTQELAMLAGDYHSGMLSTIIPLGIWGLIGLIWIWCIGVKVLYLNFRYGDPAIKRINTFMLAYFIARILQFIFVFGGLYGDLMLFTGTLGLSLALNAGVRRRVLESDSSRVRTASGVEVSPGLVPAAHASGAAPL